MKPVPILFIAGKAGSGKSTVADMICNNFNAVQLSNADLMKRVLSVLFNFTPNELWGESKLRSTVGYLKKLPKENPREHILGLLNTICDKEEVYVGGYLDWYLSLENTFKRKYFSIRELLQNMGSFCRSVEGEDIWVEISHRRAKDLLSGGYTYSYEKGLEEDSTAPPVDIAVVSDLRYPNEAIFNKGYMGINWKIIKPDLKELQGGIPNHSSESSVDLIPSTLIDDIIINDGSLKLLETKVCDLIRKTFY
jgi:hypothetical protein